MATREEIIARAREIIVAYPTYGKARVNQYLRAEYGTGLRSSTILKLKRDVAAEQPRLAALLYQRGSVPKGLNTIYRGWMEAGFMPFEARELTLGHGERYRAFDAKAVFDSAPGVSARQFRRDLIKQQLAQGWTIQQIKDNVIDFYRKSKVVDPWEHIRAEYKPRKKVDVRDYRTKIRQRAKAKQQRLLKRMRKQ